MTRRQWIALIAILLLATALRVVSLDWLPPGLYHDEAFSGLDALGILRGAAFPIFFEGNGGREPFFIYAHALSLALFGATPWALRIPAAFVGVLTIAAFFSLVRVLTRDKHATFIALIAAAGLTTSYWHLNFSRVGWRTISLPLFACLAFYWFWRARRSGGWRDHIIAGALLGASLYTYLAARFLPLVIVLFWASDWLVSRWTGTESRVQRQINARDDSPARTAEKRAGRRFVSTIFVLAALVVFAPLGYYFVTHPNAFLFRVSDVALAGDANDVLANLWRVAQMFFTRGDAEWRHGIAHRPVLDGLTSVLFALGLISALWQWREPTRRFVLIWFLLLLAPTILSQDAPDTQRAIGALPAMFVFVAWGAERVVAVLVKRFHSIKPLTAWVAVAVVLVLNSGWLTVRDYFVVWANDRRAYYDFRGDLADLARWMNAQPDNLILPLEFYAEPTIHFLTLSRVKTTRSILDFHVEEQARILNESGLLVLPRSSPSGAFVLLDKDAVIFLNPIDDIPRALTAYADSRQWQDKWSQSCCTIVPLPNGKIAEFSNLRPFTPFQANLAHRLDLVGYDMNRNIEPGKPFPITLYWSSRTPGFPEGIVFVHLLDWQGAVVTAVDKSAAQGYHSSLLPQNQVIPDRHVLVTDASLAPGRYSIEIGMYRRSNGTRLAVWIDDSRAADDRIILASPKVLPRIALTFTPTHVQRANFGQIALLGYDWDISAASRRLHLTLYFQALAAIERDYTLFAHVLNTSGEIVAQFDHQPHGGRYPTSIWDTNESVRDDFDVELSHLANGNYHVVIGWYDLATGARLPLRDANGQPIGDALTLDIPLELK